MRTILKCDDGQFLSISDDNFDLPGWVTVKIDTGKDSLETDILIEDLMPALIGFDAKYSRLEQRKENNDSSNM
jgi:hypothetical protein